MSQRRHESILHWWDQRNPFDEDWYVIEQQKLVTLQAECDVPLEVLCAACAIASPGITWEQAVAQVQDYVRLGGGDRLSGMYQANARKIIKLLRDHNIALHLRGWKVRSFYENLLHPRTSQRVTIDRWAMRVFGLDEKNYNLADARVYERFADSYRLAAADLGTIPSRVQAATWCAIRREEGT